jgi:hypothetical protein
MSIDAAYFSAVLVANALGAAGHPKAADAQALKDAVARALTHPDTIREEPFKTLWADRAAYSQLKIDGPHAETLAKHTRLLAEANL